MVLSEVPGETGRIRVDDWLRVLEGEYLADYIRSGGSAVKFVSGSHDVLRTVEQRVLAVGEALQYHCVKLDPGVPGEDGRPPNLHLIDRFYLQATRDVDWRGWAGVHARAVLAEMGVEAPPEQELNLQAIAESSGREENDLRSAFEQRLTGLIKERSLAIEFRAALTALCRAQLVPDHMTPTTEQVLLEWLAGRTVRGGSAALKKIRIFKKIDRSNARYMLASFCRWLPRIGRRGLLVVLDFRPYEVRRSTSRQSAELKVAKVREALAREESREKLKEIVGGDEETGSLRYSNIAYMHMLQMLRRFIDEIDKLERFMLVALVSPEYVQAQRAPGQARHYTDYDALQTRIALEVRDAKRPNPAASLVHLEQEP